MLLVFQRLKALAHWLYLSTHQVIIVDDFNIHVDTENDTLLDSVGFFQQINGLTPSFHHSLDLVLASYSHSRSLRTCSCQIIL